MKRRRFDYAVIGLAVALLATLASAAWILISLPEALDAVAAPAFGAPWITPAPTLEPPPALRSGDARYATRAGG
jgi:hypothetical protein